MEKVRLLTWLFIPLILLGSCTSHPEDAKQELSQLGIEYMPEAFLKSVGDNNVRAVELFLAAGMDPNVERSRWLPPLMTAVMNCDGHLSQDGKTHTEIAKLLITHGANVEVTSPHQPDLLMGTTKTWAPAYTTTVVNDAGYESVDIDDVIYGYLMPAVEKGLYTRRRGHRSKEGQLVVVRENVLQGATV